MCASNSLLARFSTSMMFSTVNLGSPGWVACGGAAVVGYIANT
jgi:hypothetical protein